MSKKNRQTSKPQSKRSKKVQKERGFWVGFFLVLIILHGIAATYAFNQYYATTALIARPVMLGLMIFHSLANVAAAVGIWFWKKWGLYLYAGSTLLALVIGLITVGMWSTFSIILPFVILLWLLQAKMPYFE